MSDEDTTPTPKQWKPSNRHLERPYHRTPAERDQHYTEMVERIDQDETPPWWTSEEQRRALYDRRYLRPPPVHGLTTDIHRIRRTEVWTEVQPPTTEETAA